MSRPFTIFTLLLFASLSSKLLFLCLIVSNSHYILLSVVVKDGDPSNNVPDSIFSKMGFFLHRRDDHPLGILKNEIYKYFDEKSPGLYQKLDNISPIVSAKAVSSIIQFSCN